MNNYIKHAEREFKAAGWDLENDEMQKMICDHVCELLNVFNGHGHSGTSAPYTIELFRKLAMFEPIAPLTGEDWEWTEIGEGVFQNKRCSHVFKENGQPYDIDGKIFRESNGSCYTNIKSRMNVDFPYTPKSEYIDVGEDDGS